MHSIYAAWPTSEPLSKLAVNSPEPASNGHFLVSSQDEHVLQEINSGLALLDATVIV